MRPVEVTGALAAAVLVGACGTPPDREPDAGRIGPRPADAAPPTDDLDAGPFGGAPTIRLGVGCNRDIASYEPISRGDTVRLEPREQSESRHIDVGIRGYNLALEPPLAEPDVPVDHWVTPRAPTTFRLFDDDGALVSELEALIRLYPGLEGRDPALGRTLMTRVFIENERHDAILGAPVTLEVEREEGGQHLVHRVDALTLVSAKAGCVGDRPD